MARICIVTPSALGSNPRVVKEAQALSQAGHSVRVVAMRSMALVDQRDDEIIAASAWEIDRVDLRSLPLRKGLRLLQVGAGIGARLTGRRSPSAIHPAAALLASRAAVQPADLFIGHYVAGLQAAATAARRHRVRFAFDAEDFHPGDLAETPANAREIALIDEIERELLPHCAYVTAASPGIAQAYAETYGLAKVEVILNVFPQAQGPATPTPKGSAAPGPSLYWFSQTIGPDRGLECSLRAIARSQARPHLYLRGTASAGYQEALKSLARQEGVEERLHFLPPAASVEMERLAAVYDLGLVSETGHTRNRRIALTNKQFTYLIAGLPAVMSDTEGHRAFAGLAEPAVKLFKAEDPDDLATALDAILLSPQGLEMMRTAAFDLGRSQFNWEAESIRLVSRVETALLAVAP